MVNALVVRRNTQPAKARKELRAAQAARSFPSKWSENWRRERQATFQWRAHLRKERPELCVYLWLNDSNEAIQDYVLLASADAAAPYLTLSNDLLTRNNAVRVDNVSELIQAIKARMITFSHAAPAKPRRPNKRGRPSLSKPKNGRARH
jgi:hypothetical protein